MQTDTFRWEDASLNCQQGRNFSNLHVFRKLSILHVYSEDYC